MRAWYPLVCVALVLAGACSPDAKPKPTDGRPIRTPPKSDPDPEHGKQYPPCHPGCFPAGTPVATPDGPRAIEAIRAGDKVMCVSVQGSAVAEVVHSTFRTTNGLVEVRTTAGTLNTTPVQPLCLVAGGFRRAVELKAGDRIWAWTDGKRSEAEVTEVSETGREVAVFNLVVGDSAVFVAGGFLAKGKPPLDATTGGPAK